MKVTNDEYKKALKVVIAYRKQVEEDIQEIEEVGIVDKNDLLFYSLGFKTCRLLMEKFCDGYGLGTYHHTSSLRESYQIKELEGLSKKEMMDIKGFGEESMKEVISLCERAGVKLAP